jgi:hypothetical protein
MMNAIHTKGIIVKSICIISVSLLLSSCVHYSVQRDIGANENEPCTKGSTKQNSKCKEEIKALKTEINNAHG